MTVTLWIQRLASGALLASLGACGISPPSPQVDVPVPATWHHTPTQVAVAQVTGQDPATQQAALRQWWQQLQDPLLLQFQQQALAASVDVAVARTRVAEARAGRVSAGAAQLPQLNAQISGVRNNTSLVGQGGSGAPPATVWQSTLQPQWELDLWGGVAAAAKAASQREQAAQAQLAAAHVALAAEVANAYFAERACQQQVQVLQADAASRAESARLTELSANAGFTAPADVALSRAAAADGASRVRETQVQCASAQQALAVLTGQSMADVAGQLAQSPARSEWPSLTAQAVPQVPAQLLLQRADLRAAELDVAAASGDVGEAQARRLPSVSLQGSIGMSRIQALGFAENMGTWSFGPLAINIPIFDGGTRQAQVDAKRARYDEAVVRLHASVRQAVREVEEALAQLEGSQARLALQRTAVSNFERHWRATQARHTHGMASLFELEDARRTWLSAQLAQVAAQRDQAQAWAALYRALGGGWADERALAGAATGARSNAEAQSNAPAPDGLATPAAAMPSSAVPRLAPSVAQASPQAQPESKAQTLGVSAGLGAPSALKAPSSGAVHAMPQGHDHSSAPAAQPSALR